MKTFWYHGYLRKTYRLV